ncbi:hypothetical protein GCWU000341_02272 [Oribacterium sp. oral taxon 078 str. F0262]|uniref:hypothetical protein n=1 Tax=Oribacterium sp. oral taxon 078 TaxID=652706 RepID=UPI0001BCBDC5|nr:hypothetical protein [Oribacterium sp. oral taxon 078]EFE91164.1 hypothetical protein GCWU000341_02272 [Oribacterium sp. oral taxon 078 str. F0262]
MRKTRIIRNTDPNNVRPGDRYAGIHEDSDGNKFYVPDDDIGRPNGAKHNPDAAADEEHGPGVKKD